MVSPYYPNQVPWTDKKDWVSPENPGDLVEADHVNQLYAEVNAMRQDVGSHKAAAAPHSGHETPAGAQAKAEAAAGAVQAKLDAHLSDYAPHGATSANTAGRIVMRDASGNFSAGTITATLAGSADKVDNLHFRILGGKLQYSTDGVGWYDVSNTVTVQRGETVVMAETKNVTISAVNITKAFVNVPLSTYYSANSNYRGGQIRAVLTSPTNLRITQARIYSNITVEPITVPWEVVEFA